MQRKPWGHAFTIVLIGLSLAALASFFVDPWVDALAAAHQTDTWNGLAKAISRYLSWMWIMAASVMALLICWWRQKWSWAELLCVTMISATLAGLAADSLRGLTGRTRPYVQERPQGFYGVRAGSEWLITRHGYNSFPSGHVATIVGLACPLLLARRQFGVLVLGLAVAVAAARIYVGAHHLSDVFAGAALGTLIAALVWQRYFRWQRHRNLH